MIEITYERFAELIVAETNYRNLYRIICERADSYDKLGNNELRILRDMLCSKSEVERE